MADPGLHAGDQVVVEALAAGELRIRRGTIDFDAAFGALTGVYPPGYLERLDADDEQRCGTSWTPDVVIGALHGLRCSSRAGASSVHGMAR